VTTSSLKALCPSYVNITLWLYRLIWTTLNKFIMKLLAHCVVIVYQRLGTTYRSHFYGSRVTSQIYIFKVSYTQDKFVLCVTELDKI
jgi:hypothetical protein